MGWIARTFLLLTVVTLISGCAHAGGGRLYTSDAWKARQGSLGKVVLTIAGPAWGDEERASAVRAATVETLEKFPATAVVAGKDHKQWDKDAAEAETLAAAGQAGADTACILSVGECDAMFYMGLPVLYGAKSRVAYSLRVLDVSTGQLLIHSFRYLQMGSKWQLIWPEAPAKNLKRLLAWDLRSTQK